MSDALAIDLRDVRFFYGPHEVIAGLTLKVHRGETLGFVGPNGAGKTTTFNLTAGYLKPRSGQVHVLGGSPRDISRVKGKLAILPQDAQLVANVGILPQLTFFAELLGFEGTMAREEAMRVLELVGLADEVKKFPGHLSHGMAKRVGIAQAFLGSPELVLLDEPTAGLDPFAAKQVRDLIASMRGERTMVVSSHNLAEIQDLCTEIALIHQGKILRHDSVDSFTAQENLVHIQIIGGHPPIGFFQSVETWPGVTAVTFDAATAWMNITLGPDAPAAEEVIKRAVGEIFGLGLSIGQVQRGTSLEDAFMSMTRGEHGARDGAAPGTAPHDSSSDTTAEPSGGAASDHSQGR